MSDTATTATDLLLKQKLAESVQLITDTTKKGIDFSMAQLPDVVQQFITYNLVTSLILVTFGILLWIPICILVKNTINDSIKNNFVFFLK